MSANINFKLYLLSIGKKLGTGAFGIVLKGEAHNIIENESVTTVAVKMARNNGEAGNMKALVDELKIMLHVGEHLNIVNLLGACTKTIIDGNYISYLQQSIIRKTNYKFSRGIISNNGILHLWKRT